jgi:hypothetical protein
MRRTIELTVFIEVEATNQDVYVAGLFDLDLDVKSNTEGFRILNVEILDGNFNNPEFDEAQEWHDYDPDC